MSRNYSSVAAPKTLSATITNSVTQITLNSLDGLPSAPYILVIDPDTTSEEAVLVTSVSSGTTLNVTRAIETNATAQAHTVGATVRHMIVASDLQNITTHVDASTGVHGLSAGVEVVGRTQSQILTNKTISLGSNTVSGTRAQFNGSMSDDDFATINGNETLLNKTLTSPTITGPTISGTITGAVVTSANIVDGTIVAGDLADGAVTSAKILDGTIVDADINASAAIVASKLTGTTAEFNGALSDGDFATLAGTETLTNKTINLSSNTLSGTTAQFNAALSDNDFVTITGTESLANKSLQYPSFYQPSPFTSGTATLTLTVYNVEKRILIYNGTNTANHTWTLPSASELDSYFTTINNNYSFDFSVINTNPSGTPGLLTLGLGSGITAYGIRTIFAADIGGHFRLHKTGTATWSLYRLA